jgi:endonuclease YncB( thermonuclease family)
MKLWLALILLWTAAAPTFAQNDSDTSGTGTSHGFAVSDGDTVRFGRQRIRLFGIDAPEKAQPCDDGQWYPGPLATKALVDFIAGRPVSCHQVDYGWKNSRPRRSLLCRRRRSAGAHGLGWLGVGLYCLQ